GHRSGRAPLEQGETDGRLELRHGPARVRLRHAHPARPGADAALLHHRDEQRERAEVRPPVVPHTHIGTVCPGMVIDNFRSRRGRGKAPRMAQRTLTPPPSSAAPARPTTVQKYFPGLLLCFGAVLIAMTVNAFLPGVSPLIVAIVAGIALTNVVRLPESTAPGITLASKKLLRLGIVFLGLQLVISDILSLGAPMLVVIVCIVGGGLLGTVAMGRLLKMRSGQALLIACGFSICGAAAVAGVEGVTDTDEEEVVTAVALVVIFGTLMIPLIPFAGQMLGLDAHTNGLWAGGSIHEIAQVVAAGGIIGGGALGVAVIVKLARVLMLAPIVAILSVRQRRLGRATADGKKPPLVPLFIIGFLLMVILR